MLSEPNYKLLKPVLVFNNSLLALFYIFILLPDLFGVSTDVYRWILRPVCFAWDTVMLFVFPFSSKFRAWLTTYIRFDYIIVISSATTLLFLLPHFL